MPSQLEVSAQLENANLLIGYEQQCVLAAQLVLFEHSFQSSTATTSFVVESS